MAHLLVLLSSLRARGQEGERLTDQIRQQAETALAQREARLGPVANREAWLKAAMRGIESRQASHPVAKTGSAQQVIRDRNEASRKPLPGKPSAEDQELAEYWFERIRQQLGR